LRETRKLAAILVTDVAGYSQLAGAEEERTLALIPCLRSDLIHPAIAAHCGRIVKRAGDGVRATPACRLTAASSFASAFIWATSSRRLGAGRECFLLKPERI
jgi:class 3 adenylate cyclase